MGLLGAERGQSVQIGAVLLFGILVIFLATYQAFVVPSQNEKVEFKHSEQVQSQLQDLRNAVVSSASRESAKSVAIDLGTTYPSRIFALNPPPTSGTLRTVGTSNGSVALAIDNATAVDGETDDFWNGTKRGYSTGLLTYNPDYNLLKQMPTTVYGNTVLYNAFGQKSVPITGQTMIDGNELSLFVLNGSLNTGGSGTETVDVRPVSASEQSILVEPNGTSNITISFPSKLSAEKWRDLLKSEMSDSTTDNKYVTNVSGTSGTGAFNSITVTLEASATYRMRMVKVGVGTNVEAEGAAYLTVVDGPGTSVESGGTTQVTLEVRDAFNNPVSSVRVNASASSGNFTDSDNQKSSGVDGHVTFTYDASGVAGGTTQQLKFSLSVTPGSNFDPSTAENVTMSLSITQQDGRSNPAYRIRFDRSAMNEASYPGLTCPDDVNYCTYNASADEEDSTFNLTAVTTPTVFNASVDFALNTTDYGTFTKWNNETINGTANATFKPDGNGTITAFVASGSDSDSIPIQLVNTSSNRDTYAQNVEVAQVQIDKGDIRVQFRNNNQVPVTFSRARLDSYTDADPPNSPREEAIDRVIYRPDQSGPALDSGGPFENVGGPTLSNGGNQDVRFVRFSPRSYQTKSEQYKEEDAESSDTMTITIEFDDGSTRKYQINP